MDWIQTYWITLKTSITSEHKIIIHVLNFYRMYENIEFTRIHSLIYTKQELVYLKVDQLFPNKDILERVLYPYNIKHSLAHLAI